MTTTTTKTHETRETHGRTWQDEYFTFVKRIEAVPTLAGIGRGQGGYWEDVAGYQWYAGI